MKNILINKYLNFINENEDKDVASAEDEDNKVQRKRKASGKSDQRTQGKKQEPVASFSELSLKRAINKAVKNKLASGNNEPTPEPEVTRRKEVTSSDSRMMGGTEVTKGDSKSAEDPGNPHTETVYNRYLHPTDKNAKVRRGLAKAEMLELAKKHERAVASRRGDEEDKELSQDFRELPPDEQEKIVKDEIKGYRGNPEKGTTTVAVRTDSSSKSENKKPNPTGTIGTAIDIKDALEAKKAKKREEARLRKQAQRARQKAEKQASQKTESYYISSLLDLISENLVVEACSRLHKQWDGKKSPSSQEEKDAQFNGSYESDDVKNNDSQASKSENARRAYLKRKNKK